MAFNDRYNCVVSGDSTGALEYWVPDENHELPKTVGFEYKTQTDLYEFKKCKSAATSITFSADFEKFVTMSNKDRQVRVWKTRTGKMLRKYDESLDVVNEMQQVRNSSYMLCHRRPRLLTDLCVAKMTIDWTKDVQIGRHGVWSSFGRRACINEVGPAELLERRYIRFSDAIHV